MLMSWMLENNSKTWSLGLHEVQFRKNIRYHSGHKFTPYELLFNHAPKEGLKSIVLDKQLLKLLENVSDLPSVGIEVDENRWEPIPIVGDPPLSATDIGIDVEQFHLIKSEVIIRRV
jgi:hypothetical protein